MNVKDCFENRLLRHITPDKEKSSKSFEIAKKFYQTQKNLAKELSQISSKAFVFYIF